MKMKKTTLHSAARFSSCKDFFDRTREEEIDALCTQIYKSLHPAAEKMPTCETDGEYASWYHSLPDLAQLLYDPERYRQETAEEADQLKEALNQEIRILEELSASEALRDLLSSEAFRKVLSSSGLRSINKAVDHNAAASLRSLEESFSILSEDRLADVITDLKKQKDELSASISRMKEEEACLPFTDLNIEIEYPLSGKDSTGVKRIDVLLSKPSSNRYAIIELKQWTEDSIDISISEDEETETECMVRVLPGNRSQLHPALKVRDIYKKMLAQQLDEGAVINCFVYLHNQLYDGSQLIRVYRDNGINIFEDGPWPNNILYTKLWHTRLLNRLKALFCEE